MLTMLRHFRAAGSPYILPPGTPKEQVEILRTATRKTLNDPQYHAEFKKLVGGEPTTLTAEELEKVIRELPRDPEVLELFKKLSGPDPLPPRS